MAMSIIDLFTYIFDLFILSSYLNSLLYKRNNRITTVFFYLSYIAAEIILYFNEALTDNLSNEASLAVTTAVSLVTIFALTFLYQTNLYMRILSAVLFQVLAMFAEYAFTGIMLSIYPEIWNFSFSELNFIMSIGSQIFLFFFTIIVNSLFGKVFRSSDSSHSLLLFTTPVITIIIMFFTPLRDIGHEMNRSFFYCLYLCLALLNIINYILLNHSYKQTTELFRLKQSETLIQFQQEKYKQLSSAYKANRSLIHDTKKHYFVIKKYIENQDYEKLNAYLDITISEIEHTYSEINTGNLVIDSFVTNYKNICEENGVTFITDLSVDYNRIPVNDYELCIILGNLLDNSINACAGNTSEKNCIKLTITSNDNDIFYINTKNTYNRLLNNHNKNSHSSLFEHGYGLNNVRRTVENNHGIMNVHSDELFTVDIVLPVTKNSQRISPPQSFTHSGR